MKGKGKLYGVSLGPGDPGLLTMRAHRLLQGGAIWTYPVRSRKSASYALDIARRAGLTPPGEHAALVFPMTHDRNKLQKHWQSAAETVIAFLLKGLDVVFLVEGDASTYSTYGHLERRIRAIDAEIETEIIAGVSSFNAAAARLDFPLAEMDDTIAILPANYGIETIDRLLDEFDTLVLMKVKPMIDEILSLLERRNLLSHAAFVEKAGTPEERRFHDVTRLAGQKVNYLSLMLVKNPYRSEKTLRRGCRGSKNTGEAPT